MRVESFSSRLLVLRGCVGAASGGDMQTRGSFAVVLHCRNTARARTSKSAKCSWHEIMTWPHLGLHRKNPLFFGIQRR